MPHFLQKWRRKTSGFSLPEVAIATAIAALALVSIMGLVPSALDNIRVAGSLTAEARISAQVIAQIQLANWGEKTEAPYHWKGLETALEKRWYFDDQANLMNTSDADFATRLTYVATANLASRLGGSSGVEGEVIVPGGTSASVNSKAVQIKIATTTDSAFAFSNPKTYTPLTGIVSRQIAKH